MTFAILILGIIVAILLWVCAMPTPSNWHQQQAGRRDLER